MTFLLFASFIEASYIKICEVFKLDLKGIVQSMASLQMVTDVLLQKLSSLSQEHPSKHKCCIKFGILPITLQIW